MGDGGVGEVAGGQWGGRGAAGTGGGTVRTDRASRFLVGLVVVGGIVLAGAALRVAMHDPTSEPVSGDQASFVYQALSLRGGDLSYDADDQARWLELGWADQPHGLFVQQRGDGWAFAKPLGYSVLLARSEEHTSELQSLMRNS